MPASQGPPSRASFVERNGLRTEDEARAADETLKRIEKSGIETLRLSFADQHGLLRGKSVMPDQAASVMANGCTMTSTLLTKDTSHRTVFPAWSADGGLGMPEMSGAGDFVMVPMPGTYRELPWSPGTGWMQCDIYFPDGTPVPFCTRRLCLDALGTLGARGYDFMAGLEVEFHLFKLEDPKLAPEHATQPASPPEVSLLAHGFQYLTEARMDELEPALDTIRRDLVSLGLPLRSQEVEFGPSQCEFTFAPLEGIAAADTMMLFRSAVKQSARRNGLHATFMCRPQLANLFSSGWHFHQCLIEKATGANAFMAGIDSEVLCDTARHYIGGLLAHAAASSVFTTPTINGYKRYRPYTLAPDRAVWGSDNKGTMIRALGAPGDPASRIENRVGEPAANPYLYMASQIAAGLDGIEHKRDPGPPSDTPYDSDAEPLPASLMDAVDALDRSDMFRKAFGDRFVDYLIAIKRHEIRRFLSDVTDWEQREYFELF